MSLIKIFVTHISNREDEVIDNSLYVNVIDTYIKIMLS